MPDPLTFRNFCVKRKNLGQSALVMREEKRQDLVHPVFHPSKILMEVGMNNENRYNFA